MLVLLSISSSKLLAQWQGPYGVVELKGNVNYTTRSTCTYRTYVYIGVNRSYLEGTIPIFDATILFQNHFLS